MNIKYEFTEQDYIDFNIYHSHHSPSIKRLLRLQRYGVALLLMILVPVMHLIGCGSLIFLFTYFAVIAIVWIIIYPKVYERSLKRRIIKLVEEGKRNYLFGWHELTITQDGIHGKTEASETTWHCIEKAVETEKHVLVYVNSITAVVISKNAFASSEEKDRFLNELNRFK